MNAKNSDYGSFGQDVIFGLNSTPKTLSSKYFYDGKGDKLFQQIMDLPEYYLTRKEFEILQTRHEEILAPIIALGTGFNLVELGAGDGLKTKILLHYLNSVQADFTYFPIDFSSSVLEELTESLADELPDMKVKPLEDTYRGALKHREWDNGKPTLILFLGSNLGNFSEDEALDVLDHLRVGTSKSDMVLIGFDLKKNPQTILNAYNDSGGVTKAFNFNLLSRINQQFDADFDVEKFVHWPTYDPVSGECRSYLVSTEDQKINLKELGQVIYFEAFESIFMEVSKKYSISEIQKLADRSGFEVMENFLDSEHYFADVLWRKK